MVHFLVDFIQISPSSALDSDGSCCRRVKRRKLIWATVESQTASFYPTNMIQMPSRSSRMIAEPVTRLSTTTSNVSNVWGACSGTTSPSTKLTLKLLLFLLKLQLPTTSHCIKFSMVICLLTRGEPNGTCAGTELDGCMPISLTKSTISRAPPWQFASNKSNYAH